MARIQVLKPHGTMQRYRQGGCNPDGSRCDECKRANSDYQANYKLGLTGSKGNVTPIKRRSSTKPKPSAAQSDPAGAVEKSVNAQLKDFADEHPVQVEMALVAARILDNEDRVALHPTTLRQLGQIVETLTAGKKKKSRGRLAAVQQMTARRSGNG